MKRSIALFSMSVAVITMVAWSFAATESDPTKVAPDVYKVLLDNDRVRVLDVHLKPGQQVAMHSHPDYVTFNFDACKVRFTSADGKSEEANFNGGESTFRAAESHSVENIGSTEAHVLNIELKAGAQAQTAAATTPQEHVVVTAEATEWKDGPPSLPAGGKMSVIEGDPSKPGSFTMRAKLPAGYKIPPHWHPAAEHITVISGKLQMGMGDELDTSKGTALTAGTFAMMPAKMHHYAWTDEETVIQLHGVGPWGITYINPADDPRGKAK